MGVGNSIANGTVGDQTGPSGLIRINPKSGSSRPYASGLSMGNGVDRGPDGSFYASNDFGSNIDLIRNGETQRGWAKVDSGNGLQVDSTGKWLYVAQTFRPAAIQRVEIANPQNVTPFAVAPPEDAQAGFDGMDRDAADNLYVAANGAGSVWKVTPDAQDVRAVARPAAVPRRAERRRGRRARQRVPAARTSTWSLSTAT